MSDKPNPAPTAETQRDPARRRLLALQAIRLTGVALAMLGAAMIAGKVDGPHWLGLLLLIAGVFDVLVFPLILARRWRSPQP